MDPEIQSMVTSSFAQYLNIHRCSPLITPINLGEVSNIVFTNNGSIGTGTSSSASSTQLVESTTTSDNSTQATSILPPTGLDTSTPNPSKSTRKLTTKAAKALGISISISAIVIFAFILSSLKVYRKRKRAKIANQEQDSTETRQPYFQQKGELEAEENAKYELDAAAERKHELDGENEIREMQSTANVRGRMDADQQELQGEVHCGELRAGEHAGELQ